MSPKERFKLMPAVAIILKQDNSILLQKRKGTGWNDGEWALVGGGVDGSETILQAATREAQEELGIIIKKDDIKVVHVLHYRAPSGFESITFYLEVSRWQGTPRIMEPDKAQKIEWFDLNELPNNTIEMLKTTLTRVRNKILYGEWGWE